MKVTLNEVMAYAEKHNCAIAAFNTPNFENMRAAIDAAEELNVPIIIAHAQVHEPDAPLRFVAPVMVKMAELARVPVCVHLDHGTDLNYMEEALKCGFTSAMYDGSLLPLEENIKNTKIARELTNKYGANLEAEIGVIGGRLPENLADAKPEDLYTKPEDAKRFVEETKIDALACGFGTSHGIYKAAPKLSFSTVENVRSAIGGLPIVMHGGSGISTDGYRSAIKAGVRKINYYTYMSKAGLAAAKAFCEEHPEEVYYHSMATAAYEAMKADFIKAMKIFYNL